MARYYRHNPVEYESMFVPLPLDLFAAKMQQAQQGYDQLGLMKSQFEDEFRKVNRLPVDIEKTNERLKTEYVQEFNNLVDKSNGDISTMASGLKNLHRKFQEDLQYGHFGAIEGNYNAYLKQKEDIEKRFADDKITMNAKLKALDWAYEDFTNAGGTQDLGNGKFSNIQFADVVGKWDRKALTDQMDKVREDSTAYKSSINGETIGGSQSWVTRNKLTTAGLQWLEADDLYQKNLDYDFEAEHRGVTEEQLKNHFTQTDANGKSYYDLLVEGRNSLQQDYANASKKPGFTNNDAYVYGENIRYYNNLIDKLDKGDYAGARELEWKRERSLSDIASDVTANETSNIKTTYGYVNKEGLKDVTKYGYDLANQKLGEAIVLNSEAGSPADAGNLWKKAIADAEAGGKDGRSTAIRTLDAMGGLFTGPQTILKAVTSGKDINEYLLDATTAIMSATTPEEAANALEQFTGTRPSNMTSDDLKAAQEALLPSINQIRTDAVMDENMDLLINKSFGTKWGDLDYSKLNASGDKVLENLADARMEFVDAINNGGEIDPYYFTNILGKDFLKNHPEYNKYIKDQEAGFKYDVEAMPANLRKQLYDEFEKGALIYTNSYIKKNPGVLYNNSKEAQSYVFHDYTAADGGIAETNKSLNLALGGLGADEIAGTTDGKGTEFAQLEGGLDEWVATKDDAKYSDHALYGPGWASVTFVRKDDPNAKKTIHVNMSKLSPNVISKNTGDLMKDAISYERALAGATTSNAADLNTMRNQLNIRYMRIGDNVIGALRPMETEGEVQIFTMPTNTGGAIPMQIRTSKNRYTNELQYDIYGLDANGKYTIPVAPADGSATHGDLNAVRTTIGTYYALPQSGNVNPNFRGGMQSNSKGVQETIQYLQQKGLQ